MTIQRTRLREQHCPHCSKVIDSITNFDGQTPAVGALVLCFYCGGAGEFTANSDLRAILDLEKELTPEIVAVIKRHQACLKLTHNLHGQSPRN